MLLSIANPLNLNQMKDINVFYTTDELPEKATHEDLRIFRIKVVRRHETFIVVRLSDLNDLSTDKTSILKMFDKTNHPILFDEIVNELDTNKWVQEKDGVVLTEFALKGAILTITS